MNESMNIGSMHNTTTGPNYNIFSDEKGEELIKGALSNVLSDLKFQRSPLMSAFLSYVVQETVAGNSGRIKAYSVGVDALGKAATFDPQTDPSVRVLANRLRASLDDFNRRNPDQELVIALYRGSYVPHFFDRSGYEHVQSNTSSMHHSLPKTPPILIFPERQHTTQNSNRVHLCVVGRWKA